MQKKYWIPITVFVLYVATTLFLGYNVADDYLIYLNPLLTVCVEGCMTSTIVSGVVLAGLILSFLTFIIVSWISSRRNSRI